MVKLFEFEAKNILKGYGIKVPVGEVVKTPEEAFKVAEKIGKPVAIKSQVLVAGRGKAGGIRFAETPKETCLIASQLLGSKIKGLTVESLLVEEKLDISEEYYAGLTIDRTMKTYAILASTEGGVDVEEVAARSPEKIIKYNIDPLRSFEAWKIARKLGFKGKDLSSFTNILLGLYRTSIDYDAELAEANPVVKTLSGDLVVADACMIIDDNALYRHQQFKDRVVAGEYTALEAEARKLGLSYVDLEGNIGIIGNGAGLVMATLDVVKMFGGKPANFLDVGGGASPEVIKNALKVLFRNPRVKVVLMNIFGGITHCDRVAFGIAEALKEFREQKPLIVRIIGTREEEAEKILREAGIEFYREMEEAIKKAVSTVKGE
jgi:succinyl-CoA synthetase beta subunit